MIHLETPRTWHRVSAASVRKPTGKGHEPQCSVPFGATQRHYSVYSIKAPAISATIELSDLGGQNTAPRAHMS
jgi:hypothetical protein